MDPRSGFLCLNDGQLFYEAAGSGEPVVFLHGFGLDLRMWEPQFQAFQSTFRVIRYDFRGFGRSSTAPATSYAHEEDLQALLSELGAVPAHVVSLSMGGRFALRFAAAFPRSVRSLVLADVAMDGYAWSEDWQTRWAAICSAARADRLAEARSLWLEHPLFASARGIPQVASELAHMIHDYSGWHWRNRDTARVPSPSLAGRLCEIRMPSLVITGERDIEDFQAISRILAKGLPAAEHKVLQNAGHMANLEVPEEFNAAVLTFLQGA